MDEIATKLLQATNIPNQYETTLTITGAGGFGKTATVTSLCHYPVVNKHFTDGFVFIKLGPQASDPSIKLSQLYHLLTGENLKHCDINHAEQEIKQITCQYYHNLLVIIDDVWHVEDAEPLVKAFSNCKTILTTRMNDIEQYIPSMQSVTIGPMTQHEAITLLTSGVIDSSQLAQKDVRLLDDLAQDVHLWPLLLSLTRGQFSHYLKHCHLSYHKAIQNVQANLHHKGLTAFDKNSIEAISKSRNLAVKACIEITLELLPKSLSDKIKTLIILTGIGTSLQKAVLSSLWKISKQEAEETVNVFWTYGLVQYTDTTIFPNNITQHCVEVHAVISQYVIECMDSKEMFTLSPLGANTLGSVNKGISLELRQSYGVDDPLSLPDVDHLKYRLIWVENYLLICFLRGISEHLVFDPHILKLKLRTMKLNLMSHEYIRNIIPTLDEEFCSLITSCHQALRDAIHLCRKFNQTVQRVCYEKKYDKLIPVIEEFIKQYPVCKVAQKAVTMVKQIKPYCDDKLWHTTMLDLEFIQMMTPDYHQITVTTIPYIRLCNKVHKQITSSLFNGSPDIKETYDYFMCGKFDKDSDLVISNVRTKLQEVAPNYVHSNLK